ncbi:MAG: glycosyltransferase family 4 protein [Actinomycetota bacterium]
MLGHLAVGITAAVVTAVSVPTTARLARRLGAVADPPRIAGDERRAVPSLGGLAMLLGFLCAVGLAALLPDFAPLFSVSSEPVALVLGALIIVSIGVLDDVFGLPPTVKLAGQIVAALAVVVLGIELVFFWIPGFDMIALSSDLSMPLTVIALVAMINAINLIDGLDGLAAGVAAIAAMAFFAFTMASGSAGLVEAVPISASPVAAAVAGMSLGFLVHNWHPARSFMGDTGSMLLGLLLGAAGVSYVGRTVTPSAADFTGALPLVIPALVLAIPMLDTTFAIVRRVVRGQPVTAGDRGHLHHLLLTFGHSHRRAVIVLYYWSTLLAVGSVGPAYLPLARLAPWLLVATASGIALTALGARGSGRRAPTSTAPGTDEPAGAQVFQGPGSDAEAAAGAARAAARGRGEVSDSR